MDSSENSLFEVFKWLDERKVDKIENTQKEYGTDLVIELDFDVD